MVAVVQRNLPKSPVMSRESILQVVESLNQAVIGQEAVVERMIVALLTNLHVLLEGLPGTAKTRSIKTLSKLIESEFGRVQFTPDQSA